MDDDDRLYEDAVRTYRNLLAAVEGVGEEPDRGHSVVSREHRTVVLRTRTGEVIRAFDFARGEDRRLLFTPHPLDIDRFFGDC